MRRRSEKNLSLNRTLVLTLVVGFGVLLTLLVFTVFYSIAAYQKQENLEWEALLTNATDDISEELDLLSADAFSIYTTNGDFDILREELEAVAAYTAANSLNETLYGMMSTQEALNGYCILYNGMKDFQSFYEADGMTYADMAAIRSGAVESLKNSGKGRFWSFEYYNGKVFAVCSMKKGNVAVLLVSCLEEVVSRLEQENPDLMVFFARDEEKVSSADEGMELVLSSEDEKNLFGDMIYFISNSGKGYSQTYRNYSICSRPLEDYDLWMAICKKITLWSYLNYTQLFLIVVTLAAMFVYTILYLRYRSHVIRPLELLVEEMNEIGAGSMDHRIHVDSVFSEIKLVEVTLQRMIDELEHQKNISYEQTIEKQKAQLQYLAMQLKPHFYLNGLKTLNAFAMNGDQKRMQDLIMRLSYHMRYILQLEKDMVLLQDEIDYVNNYLELQRDMTDRPLAIDWNMEENLGEWRVPTLCIQTFVENSFKYARVGSPKTRLVISITIDRLETEDGNFLDINIHDNGNGYPDQILDVINGDPTENSASVGVNNLKRRCRILYGERAEYNFYNDDGAVSELILPEKRG